MRQSFNGRYTWRYTRQPACSNLLFWWAIACIVFSVLVAMGVMR